MPLFDRLDPDPTATSTTSIPAARDIPRQRLARPDPAGPPGCSADGRNGARSPATGQAGSGHARSNTAVAYVRVSTEEQAVSGAIGHVLLLKLDRGFRRAAGGPQALPQPLRAGRVMERRGAWTDRHAA